MSHKDYSKMSTASSEVKNDDVFMTSGYISTNTDDTIFPESTTTVATSIAEPEITEPIEGIVSGCERLNVREEPNKNADIVCVIEKDASVIIDVDDSTDSFYKVCTEAGAEGYCMKNFITITQ